MEAHYPSSRYKETAWRGTDLRGGSTRRPIEDLREDGRPRSESSPLSNTRTVGGCLGLVCCNRAGRPVGGCVGTVDDSRGTRDMRRPVGGCVGYVHSRNDSRFVGGCVGAIQLL
jgi:hypothetical protein